jgi:copper resistance protein C
MRSFVAALLWLLLIVSAPVAHAFSNLTVTDANGIVVSQGKGQVSGNVMRASLKPLSAGFYKVNWRAVSTDTHKTEGNFTFSVDAY